MEIAGMEGGETEENDRAGGKGNAGVGKVKLVRGNCDYHFGPQEKIQSYFGCVSGPSFSL